MEGTIYYRDRAKQLVLFDDMRWLNKGMSDIDGVLDFKGEFFCFIETKLADINLTTGQRILLENLCTAIEDSGRKALALVTKHDVIDPEQDVYLRDTLVTRYYCNGKWSEAPSGRDITALQAVTGYMKNNDIL